MKQILIISTVVALLLLGGLIWMGGKTPQMDKAQEANLTDPVAINALGEKYYAGSDGYDRDIKRATELFEKAANMGNAAAVYNLGVLHQTGEFGGKPDMAKAIDAWSKAAENGYGPAMMNLGQAYGKGDGVPQDLNAARDYFTNALEAYNQPNNGYPDADKVKEMLKNALNQIDQALGGSAE